MKSKSARSLAAGVFFVRAAARSNRKNLQSCKGWAAKMQQHFTVAATLIFRRSASVKFSQIFFLRANADAAYGNDRVKLRIALHAWLMELIRARLRLTLRPRRQSSQYGSMTTPGQVSIACARRGELRQKTETRPRTNTVAERDGLGLKWGSRNSLFRPVVTVKP